VATLHCVTADGEVKMFKKVDPENEPFRRKGRFAKQKVVMWTTTKGIQQKKRIQQKKKTERFSRV
jgi:hypothetical protein